MLGEALTQLRTTVEGCIEAPAWSLADAALVERLAEVHALEQRLAVVKLRLVREIDARALAGAHGATGIAVWLRERLRIDISTARRLVELARAVDHRPTLDQALSDGAVNTEQAQVIAALVTELPAQAGAELTDQAEALLIQHAAQFEPHLLRRLGARVLSHVAPEVAEAAEARAVARQERHAWQTRSLTLTRTGDGRTRLTGWLDAEAAATLTAALDPLCSPARVPATSGAVPDAFLGLPSVDAGGAWWDGRTPAQRRADALVELCQLVLASTALPDNGGDRPQLTVTIGYQALREQVGRAVLDTGEMISAAQVRRIACDAQVIPAVLGGSGQVLDVGQSRRLFTGPLRRALVLRDGGCGFPGCDRPSRWCHGHHIRSWVDGGATSLDNAVLLCGRHHRVVHDGDWVVRLGRDRRPEFIPPAYVDPSRRPRRNLYHRRN